MATKLKNLRISKVDFVDEGANPDAHIKLTKSKGEKGQSTGENGDKNGFVSRLFGFIGKKAGMNQEEIDSAVEEVLKGNSVSFNERFNEIKNRKVVTALNTITDATSSNSVDPLETTYDKIYLPALEQMSIEPQLAGEGTTWDYWKRASSMTTKMKQYQTYPQIRTFAIENHTSPQHVRLRSAFRGNSYGTWYVGSSGYVFSYYDAYWAGRCAPACDFC